MNAILDFLSQHWEILSLLLYEIVARVWPTKWNISILDQVFKLFGLIVKNRRVPDGNESIVNYDGKPKNFVKVDLTKHIVKSLLIIGFVGIFAFTSSAQTWQNFKGIRLVNNRDTANQIHVQGSLFYDDALDSLFIYNGDRWVNLMKSSGGGTSYTFENGLTESGGVVRLGGDITQNTTIRGDGLPTLTIGSTFPPDRIEEIFIYADKLNFRRTTNPVQWVTLQGAGLEYEADYSSTFIDRSLINKGFADGAYWKTGGTTDIETAIINVNGFGAELSFRDNTSAENVLTVFDGAGVQIGNSTAYITFSPSNNATIRGSSGLLKYEADKSGSYDERTLVDKAYADTKLSGTMAAERIPFGVNSNTLSTDNAFNYNTTTNQLLLNNVSNTHSTSIFGGEIQLDALSPANDNLTINPTGFQITGLTPAYQFISDSGFEIESQNNTISITSDALQLNAEDMNLNASTQLEAESNLIILRSLNGGNIEIDADNSTRFTNGPTYFNTRLEIDGNNGTISNTPPSGIVQDTNITIETNGGGLNSGDIILSIGQANTGTDGNLIFVNIPTADPCGTAPSGTVWNDSGTLKICP